MKKPVPSESNSTIVTGDASKPPILKQTSFRLGAVIVLLVLAAATVFFVRWDLSQKKQTDEDNYQTAVLTSQRQSGNGQYEEAITTLRDYAAHGHDNTRRSYALVTAAGIYETQDKYTQALSTYRQAEKLRTVEDYVITVGIARDAERTGDKTTAIAYYKKTVTLMDQVPADQKSSIADDRSFYQAKVTKLEKQ